MIAHRVLAQLHLKLALAVALTLFFCLPYFALQAYPLFPVSTLPLSAVDRLVPFSPSWVWAYQSVYLLIAVVPWLATERDTLLRYAGGFTALSTVAFACFLFVPVAGPRPQAVPSGGMFALLVSYDSPLNALPSLHCALAAYTAFLAGELTRGMTPVSRRTALAAVGLWVLCICYATLATKQHYALDIPPGIFLGWLGHRLAWRRAAREAPEGAWVPHPVRRT